MDERFQAVSRGKKKGTKSKERRDMVRKLGYLQMGEGKRPEAKST